MKGVLVGLAFVLVACGTTAQPKPIISPSPIVVADACADKVVKAFTSTTVVPGSYKCLDAAKQNRMTESSDADIAAGSMNEEITVCGPMSNLDANHNHKFYLMNPALNGDSLIEVVTDKADGKVAFVYLAGTACP